MFSNYLEFELYLFASANCMSPESELKFMARATLWWKEHWASGILNQDIHSLNFNHYPFTND
jgi:hypothetical protein